MLCKVDARAQQALGVVGAKVIGSGVHQELTGQQVAVKGVVVAQAVHDAVSDT